MKKFKVHMGVRLTKDYFVVAEDEDNAKKIAESMFSEESYNNMDCADTDADCWEEEFDLTEADSLGSDILTEEEFNEWIEQINTQEQRHNVKIDIFDIIDKNHLNCTWYGGRIGEITFEDGWKIVIEANGEIRLRGMIGNEEIDVVDKNNSGAVYKELGSKINDAILTYYIDRGEDNGDYLIFVNNNWFEFNIVDPDGNFVDCGMMIDNLLSCNLLECFEKVTDYIQYINMAKNGEI